MVLAENARRRFRLLPIAGTLVVAALVPAGFSPLPLCAQSAQNGVWSAPVALRRSAAPAGTSPLSSSAQRTFPSAPALRTFISQAPAGARPASAAAPGTSAYSAPIPGNASVARTPATALVPGAKASSYARLPLNPGSAVARLEELRNLMPNSRPQDFQEAIGEYTEWLADLADAHWKLSQTFAKVEGAKSQAESEKQMCLKFGGLKRQAMLLKAEFLISQRRYPEALQPLVDIVSAEPKTETGQNAYRLLQEIGFSEQVAAGKPTPSTN
ncbi:MAG TPA: hypothetical protein V6D22_04015 [Candidatus Obscuribacterales bacterium]